MKNVLFQLKARGFIDAMTSDELEDLVSHPTNVYIGFDPTADSLHVGNLVAIIGLAWFQRYGHHATAVVGGATGMIGDPSGKNSERNLLDRATIEKNLKGITQSLKSVLGEEVTVLNNYDWFGKIGFIDFLRDVGKQFRMSTMLAKESVKTRLESEAGLSFTEFSYQVLQAYDFLYLYDHHKVTLQMGGSDQWGNITAGTELVRKERGVTVNGLTFPLITRSDGKKFGKSEEGAVWLNPDRLSPYEFYQYFYRMPDADLPKLFRMLTFLELDEIEAIERKMKEPSYIPNTAQKRLAEEITHIVHGQKGVQQAQSITLAAKPGAATKLTAEVLTALSKELPSYSLAKEELVGLTIIDLFMQTKLLNSKGEARRLIQNGGAYLNNEKVIDHTTSIDTKDLIEGQFLLLQVGKKKKMVVQIA